MKALTAVGVAWKALMSVDNTDSASTIVNASGRSVEVEPMTMAGRGRHAVFRDPAGALVIVLATKRRQQCYGNSRIVTSPLSKAGGVAIS